MIFLMLKGIHYQNRLFYRTQTLIKLGRAYQERFRIAASYISPDSRVLDVCSGPGDLRSHLPPGCTYEGIEASPAFIKHLAKRNIPHIHHDLRQPLLNATSSADVVVMLISLCHFPQDRAKSLLIELTSMAPKVIIVEEVSSKKRPQSSPVQTVMNYLSTTVYTSSYDIRTNDEFQSLAQSAGYTVERINSRYMVGCFITQAG